MGNERHRRIWPPNAYRTITVRATDEQFVRWISAAGIDTSKPHLGAFIARAADFYAARLDARLQLALRMEREGKLKGNR